MAEITKERILKRIELYKKEIHYHGETKSRLNAMFQDKFTCSLEERKATQAVIDKLNSVQVSISRKIKELNTLMKTITK